eukprot:gene4288-6625_t
MAELALRQNLVAPWGPDNVIYVAPGAPDSLWLVRGGEWGKAEPIALETDEWRRDSVVEVSVSPEGHFLMLRTIETCWIAELPLTASEVPGNRLKCGILYDQLLHVTATHWHPQCDDLLYCLVDNSDLAIYSCTSMQLNAVLPLAVSSSSSPSVMAFSPVYHSFGQSSFYIFTGTSAGLIELLMPVVAPGSVIPSSCVTAITDTDLAAEVHDQIPEFEAMLEAELPEHVSTQPPELIDGGCISASRRVTVDVLENEMVVGLRAQEVEAPGGGSSATVLVVATDKRVLVYHMPTGFGLPRPSPQPPGAPDADSPPDEERVVPSAAHSFPPRPAGSGFDAVIDACRVFTAESASGPEEAGGQPTAVQAVDLLVAGASGVVRVDVRYDSVDVTEVEAWAAPKVYRAASRANEICAGLAFFRDEHPELQAVTLTVGDTPSAAPSLHLRALSPGVGGAETGPAAGGQKTRRHVKLASPAQASAARVAAVVKLRKLEEWAAGGPRSVLNPSEKAGMVSAVKRVLGADGVGGGEAPFSTKPTRVVLEDYFAEHLAPALAARAEAAAALAAVAGVLQQRLRGRAEEVARLRAELEQLHEAARRAAAERQARCAAAVGRVRGSLGDTDGFAAPFRLAKAVQRVNSSFSAHLPRLKVEPNRGALRARMAAAGAPLTAAHQQACGAEAFSLAVRPDGSGLVKVLLMDGSSASFPATCLQQISTSQME